MRRFSEYFVRGGLGQTLIHAFAGSAGIRIAGMALGFLVGVQLARGLGVAGYGVYGLAMSLVSLLMIPVEFGLPQLVTREVASAHVRGDRVHIQGVFEWANRVVLILSLVIAVIALAGWLMCGDLVSADLRYTLVAGLFLVPTVAFANLRGAALRGMQHIVRGQVPEIVFRPAFFSLLLLVASLVLPSGLTPTAAMAMHTVAAALTLIFAAYMLRSIIPRDRREANSPLNTKAWLHSTVPMALTEAMRILHGNFSILALGLVSASSAVGIFRVASSMNLFLSMPVSLVHVVSGPIISRLHASQDMDRLQKLLSWVAVIMVVGVVFVTLPFVFFGEQLQGFLFGLEYGPSNAPLLVLSAGTIVGSAFGPGATLLNMTGHEKRVTRSLGFSLFLLGTLSLPLIFYFGCLGAAIANSISFVAWSAILWKDARDLLGVDSSLAYVVRYGFISHNKSTGENVTDDV